MTNEAQMSLLSPDQAFQIIYHSGFLTMGLFLCALTILMIVAYKKQGNESKQNLFDLTEILQITIEGLTVIIVIIAIVTLSLTKTITSEGGLGVISAIIGYVLGKSKSKEGKKKKSLEGTDDKIK
jgi:L-asparagine transporter-like permease